MDKGVSDYLQLLQEHGLLLGDFDAKRVGKPAEYFWTHQIWIDFRGDVKIHPDAFIGYGVKILTASHTFETGTCGKAILKHVWIDDSSFVGAFSLLYNCWLQHHSVVAAGSVVRNMTVEPYTIVAGNPARVIKKFIDGKWVKV